MKRRLDVRFALPAAVFGTIIFSHMLITSIPTMAGEETAKAPNEVIATVNGQKITRADLGDFLIKQSGEEALDFLIRITLVYQEAEELGVELRPEELEERVEKVVDSTIERVYIKEGGLSGEDELEMKLKEMGGSVAQVKERIAARARQELEILMLVEKIVGRKVTVTEKDLRDAYEEKYGEKIEACQIVVKSKRDGETVLNKLKAGADFDALARKESIDRSSASRGGKMRPFSPNSKIGRSVASLSKGEISDLIRTGNGYHIVKVLDKTSKSKMKFEDVKPELERLVKDIFIKQKASAWLISLEENADIEKNFHD